MITEKRTLIIGVAYNGQMHTELEVRPRLVKDLVAASGSPLVEQNKNNYEICCLAGQIVKLGEIPIEEITAELLLEMYADDFDVLSEAAEKARQRAASFRSGQENDQKADGGADKAGIPAG
jgi:hypothetical protein